MIVLSVFALLHRDSLLAPAGVSDVHALGDEIQKISLSWFEARRQHSAISSIKRIER